jgi:hypothetical protein
MKDIKSPRSPISVKSKDESDDPYGFPKTHNLVYHTARYLNDSSPMCVYIPSKEILFKMMKACIGVDKPQDLWIYNEEITPLINFEENF